MKYPEHNIVQRHCIRVRLKCVVMVIVLDSHIVALDHVTCLGVIVMVDAYQAIQKRHLNGVIMLHSSPKSTLLL